MVCALVTAMLIWFPGPSVTGSQTLLRVQDPFLLFALPDRRLFLVLALGWINSFFVLAVFVGLYCFAATAVGQARGFRCLLPLGRMGTNLVLNTLAASA